MNREMFFITIHPKIVEAYRQFGVFKSAEARDVCQIHAVDLRDFAADKHGSIDDAPYGGGDGMVMRADCLGQALDWVKQEKIPGKKPMVIFTSPSGKPWTQAQANKLAQGTVPLVFICGRFAGVDQRFIEQCVDADFSVGDVVLAGGELPALMIAESVLRVLPGVLGDVRSAIEDSFGAGMDGLLEYPSYTRPQEWRGNKVPEVLMSGNHESISSWRRDQSLKKTVKMRPDLLKTKT